MQIKATLRFILPHQNGKDQKTKNQTNKQKTWHQMLGECGEREPLPSLLMGLQSYTATRDISVDRHQQANNESTK